VEYVPAPAPPSQALESKDPHQIDNFMCGFTQLPVYCAGANGVGGFVA